MKQYLVHDEWKIIEDRFHPEYNKITESIFSIGNGHMGQRANFEEKFSGETFQGSYLAGIYYPDKTRVGWWKNGYPEYFAKVLNSPNWIGINLFIDGGEIDLNECTIEDYYRELNMKDGFLHRKIKATTAGSLSFTIESKRFVSMARPELGVIKYDVTVHNRDAKIKLVSYVDGNIMNEDANYDEFFWEVQGENVSHEFSYIQAKTKKTEFSVVTGMRNSLYQNGTQVFVTPSTFSKRGYVENTFEIDSKANETVTLYKFAANTTSRDHEVSLLKESAEAVTSDALSHGFETLLSEQAESWAKKWDNSDVIIEGDASSQQGIRFNIFQLNQTYTGTDARLNIGPKGFTGEKYGGASYWDTEAFCFPFYLSTADPQIAKNLLLYRYNHLERAIENAEKLGFTDGAALYPMVTMNGEECHNEWEITFEEIHRNGAIAYAIYNYVTYLDDKSYLVEYGLEVLIGIARFWQQRFNWSEDKQKYVMLGVTGPNEYENNVNNNWYTSYIARWTIEYTLEVLEYVKSENPSRYSDIITRVKFTDNEIKSFNDVITNVYLPEDKKRNIFLQQDGFLDKVLKPVSELSEEDLPINQNWSWDRILRSCYIKQADVLQGMFMFNDRFDKETLKRNFEFYEPITVHESSLSPSIHSVLASRIGKSEKAVELYLRTARLDLEDYNNDTEDGLHITSMVGSWLSIVQGFGGMELRDGKLTFNPMIPKQWSSYSFKILYRGATLKLTVKPDTFLLENRSSVDVTVSVGGKDEEVKANSDITVTI
jgi:maltose phosphorylase